MLFLALIIAVGLMQLWGNAGRVQHDTWFVEWQDRVGGWGLPAGVGLAVAVLLPTLLAYLVLGLLQPILFGLLWIAAAVLLLLYSFGRGDFRQLMDRYRGHAYSGDFEAAYLAACEESRLAESDQRPDSGLAVHNAVQRALLYEGYQRWFAVLFYFVLLGPPGALAYRLLQLTRARSEEDGIASSCLFVADWLPSRLLAAAFALTGDFIRSRNVLLDALTDAAREPAELIYGVATAALGGEIPASVTEQADLGELAAEQNRELGGLLSRSAVCWVLILALAVLLF